MMNTEPTEDERKKFDELAKSASNHFIVLVVLIALASLTFLFPSDEPLLVIASLTTLILLACLSTVRLKYFSGCPRCNARMAMTQKSCGSCGLERRLAVGHEADAKNKEST